MAATTAVTLERAQPATALPDVLKRPARGLLSTALRRLARDKLTLAAATVLLVYAVLAVSADVIATQVFGTTATRIDMRSVNNAPSALHWFGTDEFGRDLLVRVLYGARVSLTIGLSAALINLTAGVLLGAVAGFYGGRIDDVIVWLINTLRAVPNLFLLILIGALFRPGPEMLALVIGLISWPGIARVVARCSPRASATTFWRRSALAPPTHA
jgi:ABC-type dipeptide/oligopeptide/nickel transport system permease subunit